MHSSPPRLRRQRHHHTGPRSPSSRPRKWLQRLAEAKKTPYEYAFAIVNPSGNLLYFEKTDDVLIASINIAIAKAQTSATLKRPSKALFDQMETGHPYVSTLYPGIVAAAGGVLIVVDGKIIGAIGVSGSPTGLIDEKAALAGAAAVK